MKVKMISLVVLLSVSQLSYSVSEPQAPWNSGGSEKLTEYFKNFSGYFGYDVEKQPDEKKSDLFNSKKTKASAKSFVETYLSSLLGLQPPQLLGAEAGGLNFSQDVIGQTFKEFSQQDASGGEIGFSKLVNQPPAQKDPIAQAVLDILSTPNFASCFSSSSDASPGPSEDDCAKMLTREWVMANEIGTIPLSAEIYDPKTNQKWVQVLNSNNLLSPMMYNDKDLAGLEAQSSQAEKEGSKSGLIGKTQAQMAYDFVSFVSGLVLPVNVPSKDDYEKVFRQMINGSKREQMQARGTLFEYINKLRVYSAQVSVGLSNLYYIVSKRMPKTIPGENNSKQQTSQALDEFKMATWRLNPPSAGGTDTSWISQINTASPTTVQKEIAVLLAEMNYQLYLNRQQQERILLTESVLLLQGAKNAQPAPVLGTPGTEGSGKTAGTP